ncbi:hypothetical protein AS156_36575 [Bradyrhizobium macuxiense]|uniref:Solute-binding protein family 3/N-terminal domain-containing protein n=1 Tax=Bradyrhizobium macuxiense TaxID=1755647 RepID=A0A109K0L3_9BRAD|nr:transporter substrate-binding domain-containing protein [Bradyrhizobium macuxiense]KWV58304.1 hypothetical protein AS156_36575 [Bradyrhizobium macuxiense]
MHFVIPKLLVTLLATAVYSSPAFAQAESRLLASIRKVGEVKVAIVSAPPYVVISPSGEATGYGVEIVNLALKGMGLPPMTPVLLAWGAQFPALQAHQVDFVASGQHYTEVHCKVAVYSGPYFVQQSGLYVLPGNPKHLTGVAQIAQNPDIKLAIVAGGSYEPEALRQGVKTEQLVRVPDIQAGAVTVTGGRSEALLLGQVAIPHPEQKGLDFVLDKQSPVYGYGAIFRKEDVSFRDAFNEQLNLLRSNGIMKELLEKSWKEGFEYTRDFNWDLLSKLTKAGDMVPGCE